MDNLIEHYSWLIIVRLAIHVLVWTYATVSSWHESPQNFFSCYEFYTRTINVHNIYDKWGGGGGAGHFFIFCNFRVNA